MAKSSAARQERVQRSRDREAILESVRNPARGAAPADLDRLIHEHVRLGIVSALAVNRALTFSELKALLKASDGNLSVHARKLEEADYIVCEKSFDGRTPKSLGSQSFDAELLHTLGRIHTPEEIVQALSNARAAGFKSINLDFMFGLPGQTMQHWKTTLDRALALRPEHFSLYSLIIEEGTLFYTWTNEGRIIPGDEDLCADMYEYADERLQAEGYENYEISNWALPGHQSRHNLTYWQNLPYIGMGAGAHSFFGGRRFSNILDPQEYIQLLKKQQRPEVDGELIDRIQEMSETAFLAFRTAQGLHLPTFEERFAEPFTQFVGTRLRIVEQAGLLEQEQGWLRLSKRGLLLGNQVFLRLLPD